MTTCRICGQPIDEGRGSFLGLCIEHDQDYDYFCAENFNSPSLADTRAISMYVESKRRDLFG